MRVQIDELVDLGALERESGRRPTPSEIRGALPRGWVLDPDGRSARRDARMLFRQGWMLALCLVSFGAAGAGLFWWSFPAGHSGWLRLAGALAVLLLAGGIAAPILTRALSRGRNLVVLALAALFAAGCGTRARDVELSIEGKALVLVFVSIDCPISNRYLPEVRALESSLGAKGVGFRLVFADPSDEPPAIQRHLTEYGIDLPVVRDTHHGLVRRCGARVTPEAAVFLPDGTLAYRGRIDDRFVAFGQAKPAPSRRDLALAIDEILAGRAVSEPRTEAIGCPIPEPHE
ncbi:MAG: redoxin family protein [Planctomycetota bacterium]